MENKKLNKWILIGLSALIILLILVLGYFLNEKYEWISFSSDKDVNEQQEIEEIDQEKINEIETKYNQFMETLTNGDIENIKLAKEKLIELGTEYPTSFKCFNQFLTLTDSILFDLPFPAPALTEQEQREYVLYEDQEEGMAYYDINYDTLSEDLYNYVDAETKAYINIRKDIYKKYNSNSIVHDANLAISWMELADILLKYDTFLNEYENEVAQKEYNRYYGWFTGDNPLDNTPPWDFETKELLEEVNEAYAYILEHKDFSNYDEIKSLYKE